MAINMPKINNSNKAVKPVLNKLEVKAYTPDGQELPDQKQIIWNSPAGEYFPDLPVATIVTPDGDKVLPQDEAGIKEQVDKFNEPVTINGQTLHRGYAWGSGVKDGKTFGLLNDYFAEKGILNFKEDTYRIGRAYYPNSTAGLRGKIRVKLVPVGTVIPGVGPVDDGFGYMRQSFADVAQPVFKKIQMGTWQSSFSFLHRYTLTQDLFDELLPHFQQNLAELANQSFDFKSDALTLDMGQKGQYIGLDPEMKEHPYISNSLTEALGQRMFRVATTGGFMMEGGVFAPTTSDKLVVDPARFGESEKFIITRYPIDGWGSIRAVEAEQEGDEAERIANMEIVQYTLTDHFNVSFKGLLGIVDDEQFPEEWDLIICVEDEKLNRNGEVEKVEKSYTFDDAVLSFTQWWLAGSAMGVPHWLAKDLNADYDGDQGAVVSGEEFPVMLRQTETFPSDANPKLPKTKTPLKVGEPRAMKALVSMANLVGRATNTLSTVLGVVDQDFIAKEIGFMGKDEMHEFFMYAIKIGTDIFKTSADYRPVEKKLSRISTRLNKIGVRAPWTKWIRDEVAFRHEIPLVGTPEQNWTDWKKRNFVLPEEHSFNRQDAIIPTLLRWILPQMIMPETSPIKPLVHYRDWAEGPYNDMEYDIGKKLLQAYANRVLSANLSNPKAWADFENEWQAALATVCEKSKISPSRLANILWYISHSDQRMSNLKKMASAVFVGFPEESKEIVADKPGLAKVQTASEVVVTGIQYQLPNIKHGTQLVVDVVDFEDTRTGTKIVRQALVGQAEGQQQPTLPHYPKNMLGLLAIQEAIPQGKYKATFQFVPGKRNGGTWKAKLA